MKKITFSFKSLLLAAGLLLGSANAWANILSPSAGNVDNSTAWGTWDEGFTQNFTMSGNSTASFTFHYTSDPTASEYAGWTMFIGKTINTTNVWDTWITCQGFSGGYYGADGLGGTRSSSNTYAGTLSAASCTEADVTVTITRTAENITAVAAVDPTNGDDDYTITWTYAYGGSDVVDGDLYISFAVDKAYLNITEVVGPGLKTTQANISFSSAETSDETLLENSVFNGVLNSINIGQGQFRASQAGWLSLDDGTSTITIPEAQRAGAKDVVRVQFKRAWGNKNGMGSGFSLKDAEGEVICNYTYSRWSGGSNTLNINMDGLVGGAYNNAPIKDRYTIFDITIDYSTNTITSVVSCVNPNASKEFTATLTNTNPIATFNVWGYGVGGNKDRADIINDIVITTTEGDYSVITYDYTVNWQCGEDVVKTATRQGESGAAISLLGTDDDDFWESDQKYIYVSDDASSKTVAEDGSTVVTITVRKAADWKYTVKAIDGESNELKTLLVGDVVEGESASYGYPQFIAIDGTLYSSTKQGGNPWWGKSFVPVSNNEEQTITYTAQSTTDVIFCEEAEDIPALTVVSGGNTDIRASNRKGAFGGADFANGGLITTLPAGTYKIHAATYGNAGTTFRVYAGDEDTEVFSLATNGNPVHTDGENFILSETTDLVLVGGNGGNSPKVLDYIYITGTPASVVKTSSANLRGYKTFYNAGSNYQVDANTTIYKGSATPGTVTLTSVEGNIVPKNTPVVLKTTNTADYTITLTATTTEATAGAFDGNDLQVATGVESGVYILAYTNEQGFGFYNYTGTLAEGDVYLAIPGSVKMFNVVVNGETVTGVEAPVAAEAEEEEILYNTAGQQVTKDYKGVVINQKGEKRFQK